MQPIDFEKHNAEVREVWDAYRARKPIRVPMTLGVNARFTMFDRRTNPRGVTFEQYMSDPQVMLERQLEHQHWVRHNLPYDAEMGPPKDGWHAAVDFQNIYEAVWFGCPVRYYADQVPDSEPLLQDDARKNALFDAGIPDPFTGGLMQHNWEFYEYFKQKQTEGWTYKGLPIKGVSPTGCGTDGPLTVACNLRGATEFMTDLAADTDYALKLLDFITSATILRVRAYREKLGQPLRPKSFGYADDSLQLISTAMYKDLILPFHRRLVNELSEGETVSIHLCGDATRHFRFLRDTLKVQSFDTGFPVDFAWLREQLGPDVEILGGPSVAFLLAATPAEVRAEVRRVLASGVTRGGRFVLREGNNLPPGVPVENIAAMYEAARDFRF
ncbi:MAG: uroporphyrinogen decarboxylase family protein [Planctomycetota bacterium]